MNAVAITGLGCLSAVGQNAEAHWQGLREGRSAIGNIIGEEFEKLKVSTAAQVNGFEPGSHFSSDRLGLLDRHSQFALVAARQAVEQAGLDDLHRQAMAVVIGTGCGGKETDERTYARLYRDGRPRAHPFTIPRGMPSAASSQVSMDLGIQGPAFTVASACASANHAIAQAVLMIRSGLVECALAGGTDAPFTYGLLRAWEALRVLSPDTCRPFSADRKGLVLGEGAGMVVLESVQHARRRGASVRAVITGIGMSADSAHITDPSAEGSARAMQAALADAGRRPDQIDYINAHGTGTQANDVTETRAIHQVFGRHAQQLQISSTKSMHGHALGAAAAMELVATVHALEEGVLPPTANFTQPGEGCDLNYLPNQAVAADCRRALSNAFAFGGLNAVLLVERADQADH